MEIISYIGSSSVSKRKMPKKNFVLNMKKFSSKQKSFSFSKVKSIPQKEKISFIDVIYTARGKIALFQKSAKKFFKILIFLLGCFGISTFLTKGIFKFQSRAFPLEMNFNEEKELELLHSAMAKFAMENDDILYDENGNILSENGEVIIPSEIDIGKGISYSTYKIKSGDTISSISKKFGLTNISTLIAVNGIDNARTIREGQKLKIPNQDGIIHNVKSGESINYLSVKYKVSVEEILDVNDLSSKNLLAGQEIFIPGARMNSTDLKKAMGELFINPISGRYRLTSYFGRRADPFTGVASNHTGIDMACPTGTPIQAAMSGKVVSVGWSNIYGNYVIIKHGTSYQTLYAHMSKILCSSGQNVSQGTRIGLVGSTGYSTGPHLHFTVYKNGNLVDPLSLIKR